jgi:antigen flippase
MTQVVNTQIARTARSIGSPAGASTYGQIFWSTVLIGGSSVANVVFRVVRTKAMALILGPAGFGLLGIYGSIADVAQSLAGMGIQNSGVRQIAEAVGSGDQERVARTAAVLKLVAVALGALGALGLALVAGPVSQLTFGTRDGVAGVTLLSLAVLFREIAVGQGALIQGMRRIADLARLTVLSAFLETAITIPIVYIWGTGGVVPSLVSVAAVSILVFSWYGRKVGMPRVAVSLGAVGREAGALVSLGFAFMVTGFLTMGAGYVIRILVLRTVGFEAAGLYQAAWALGGLYVAFILQAMGADFYPRLTAVAEDHQACNRMVNEQAHISLLLAGPGVLATLTLAPLVIALFYSPKFYPAVTILRWVCVGMTLRVIAWPMGYIVVAKGAKGIMVATEVAATVVHVGLAWTLLPVVGLTGTGIAFCGLYVWHTLLIYSVVRRLTGFRLSSENRRVVLIFLPLMGATFSACYVLPNWLAVTLGLGLSAATGLYSLQRLLLLVSPDSTPRALRSWLLRLGFSAA